MSQPAHLTPVEWEIMEAIYDIGGSPSIRQVWEHAYPDKKKAYTTIQTIMNTLEKKGLLTKNKIGLVNFYSPVLSRTKIIKSEISNMASRMFRGSVSELAQYLMHLENFDIQDIEKIRQILDKKEQELRGNKNGGTSE